MKNRPNLLPSTRREFFTLGAKGIAIPLALTNIVRRLRIHRSVDAALGVFMPSVDRAGRLFPLTIAWTAPRAASFAAAGAAWPLARTPAGRPSPTAAPGSQSPGRHPRRPPDPPGLPLGPPEGPPAGRQIPRGSPLGAQEGPPAGKQPPSRAKRTKSGQKAPETARLPAPGRSAEAHSCHQAGRSGPGASLHLSQRGKRPWRGMGRGK